METASHAARNPRGVRIRLEFDRSQWPPMRNRVDPWGDVHEVSDRGLFTGNRGCLVDETGAVIRHHRGSLWITCLTRFRGSRHPLDEPRTWTPLFFLDEAVALAAGHRPCGLCRRSAYLEYRLAVATALCLDRAPSADDLNRSLAAERLRPGRGIDRASDRIYWIADVGQLPVGTVIVDGRQRPQLVTPHHLQEFGFGGWEDPVDRPDSALVTVLTPPTSVMALNHGFMPRLHPTAQL